MKSVTPNHLQGKVEEIASYGMGWDGMGWDGPNQWFLLFILILFYGMVVKLAKVLRPFLSAVLLF